MFDFSWGELLVVGAVAVLVIGPKDIPNVMRALGRIARRAQYLKFALSQQFEDLMKDQDLEDLRTFNTTRSKDVPETDEAEADEPFLEHEVEPEVAPRTLPEKGVS